MGFWAPLEYNHLNRALGSFRVYFMIIWNPNTNIGNNFGFYIIAARRGMGLEDKVEHAGPAEKQQPRWVGRPWLSTRFLGVGCGA